MLIVPLAIVGVVAVGGWVHNHVRLLKVEGRLDALEKKVK